MLNEFTLLYVEDDSNMQDYMYALLKDEVKEFYKASTTEEKDIDTLLEIVRITNPICNHKDI